MREEYQKIKSNKRKSNKKMNENENAKIKIPHFVTHLANNSLSGHESKGTRDLKALFPLIAGPVIVVSEGPFLVPDRPVACGVTCCSEGLDYVVQCCLM